MELESFDAGTDEESVQGEGHSFELKFVVSVRDFKGQTRNGIAVGEIQVVGADESEFRPKLFEKVLPHLKKEIVFDKDNKPSWVGHNPVIADLCKFLTFYDKIAKRNYSLNDVSAHYLSTWKHREILLYIHKYSTNVGNARLFGIAERDLLKSQRDRAGAQNNSMFTDVLAGLKARHGEVYRQAHSLNWDSWASRICHDMNKSEKDLDVLLSEPPPPDLVQLFVRSDDAASSKRLEIAREDNSVGKTINSDLQDDIQQLKIVNVDLKKHITNASLHLHKARLELYNAEATRVDFEARLNRMELKAIARESVVNATANQLRPQESTFSRSLAGGILLSNVADEQRPKEADAEGNMTENDHAPEDSAEYQDNAEDWVEYAPEDDFENHDGVGRVNQVDYDKEQANNVPEDWLEDEPATIYSQGDEQ